MEKIVCDICGKEIKGEVMEGLFMLWKVADLCKRCKKIWVRKEKEIEKETIRFYEKFEKKLVKEVKREVRNREKNKKKGE